MFYKGIVEDNEDDKKLGRVKVRIIGKHTSKNNDTPAEKMKTDDLPWAMPVFSSGSSCISGVCDFGVPVLNSVVVCGYFDSDEQDLFYIGTMGLMGDKKIDGFGVDNIKHPKTRYPYSELVENEEDKFENELTTNSLFSEPEVNHQAIYPHNKVIETESGHVIELDDSDGSERIRIRHKNGSFEEYHENGDNVQKITKDKYLISQHLNIHTEVDCNLYAIGEINVHCESDINVYGEGNINVENDLDTNITVHGATNVQCDSDINVTSNTHVTVTAPMIDLNP